MSDKKTSTGTPSPAPAAGGTFDQEFEKFLRDESTSVEAVYRKLPTSEPDAQLDARVRALASAALRSQSAAGDAPGPSVARARRRWVPAFASAAVLVLAAGVAWRMGPRNWAQQEAVRSVAAEANSASTQTVASPASAPAQAAPSAAQAPSAAKAVREVDVAAAQPAATNSPTPIPPAKPKAAQPAPGNGGGSAAARSDTVTLDEQRPAPGQITNSPRPPADAFPVRESAPSIASERRSVQGELRKAETATPPPPSAGEQPKRDVDSMRAAGATRQVPTPAAPPASTQMATAAAMAPAPDTSVSAAPRPAAAPPVVVTTQETTAAPPAAPPAATFARAQDEKDKRDARPDDLEQRKEAEVADRTASLSAKKVASPKMAPPPASPPPPPPSQAYAPEPPSPAPAAAASGGASDAARSDEKARAAVPQRALRAPEAPGLRFRARPTPEQLAAWPAPRCPSDAAAARDSAAPGYPPDVPATPQLRFAAVQAFLDMGSAEAARKAYADFAHCSPHDHWPAYLLQQLGTR